jgi:hypothetical protein
MTRLICLLALGLVTAVASAAPARIGVALLFRDGRLQPLAQLDGDSWSPLVAADAVGPWSLWLFDDPAVKTSPFAARAARSITAAAGAGGSACLPVTGFDPGPSPAAGAAPPAVASPTAAVLGIALSGSGARPDLPVDVPPDSELGRQLATRAAAAFHRAEDETLTLEAEELPAGFPRFAARRQKPVTWTRIVRQGVAQGTTKTYYLEGRKDYEGLRGRTDIGEIRTTGHVFVQVTGDRETIDAEVDLSDVEGHQSIFRTPLAMVAWPTRTAWLFANRGPDGTHLEIMELNPGTIRPRSVWQGPDDCERGHR